MSKELGISAQKYNKQTRFREDLGLDSLDFMILVVNIEDQFNLKFEQSNLHFINTVEDLENFLSARLKN